MICRKDGERSAALSPSEIAGKGAMVIKHGDADGSKSSWGWEEWAVESDPAREPCKGT